MVFSLCLLEEKKKNKKNGVGVVGEKNLSFLGTIFLRSTCSATESFEQRLAGLKSSFSKPARGEAAADLPVLRVPPSRASHLPAPLLRLPLPLVPPKEENEEN